MHFLCERKREKKLPRSLLTQVGRETEGMSREVVEVLLSSTRAAGVVAPARPDEPAVFVVPILGILQLVVAASVPALEGERLHVGPSFRFGVYCICCDWSSSICKGPSVCFLTP